MDLFEHSAKRERRGEPLAVRMRPQRVEDVCGQQHLLGADALLGRAIAADRVPSLLLWGPPGCGKTTIAQVIAAQTSSRFVTLSAVGSGVKDLRATVAEAAQQRDLYGKRTILFVDEIHRFNKSQQDALLPHVEDGTVTLIGATTENPGFEVNAALLSRVRLVRLRPLQTEDLLGVLQRALKDDAQLEKSRVEIEPDVLQIIARAGDGDARRGLNTLELVSELAAGRKATAKDVREALQQSTLRYDKSGDAHYDVISAFIKSMRGSDPHAAVYWLVRMLESGEDPIFVARRMVIFASEDVGNADPQALPLAVAAFQATHAIGMPEAHFALTQACTYLASAPKSNSALTTYNRAREDVNKEGALAVPLHLRNAPTGLARDLGHGKDYLYPHDFEGHHVEQDYLPESLKDRQYYEASASGFEADIANRLVELGRLRKG